MTKIKITREMLKTYSLQAVLNLVWFNVVKASK